MKKSQDSADTMLTRLWAYRMKDQEFDSREGHRNFRENCCPFIMVYEYATLRKDVCLLTLLL